MSNTRYTVIIGTAWAALVALACGPEQVPAFVPHVEPPGGPIVRYDNLPGADELALCFRRVPIPRC
jgi:hypothetical protein